MKGMNFRRARQVPVIASVLFAIGLLSAQVIEYEVSGVKYQTLSRQGLTVIMTRMPNHVAGFALVQVSISNGSDRYWTIAPEDFAYVKPEGSTSGISAEQVVDVLLEKGSSSDVVKLVTSYENTLYAIPRRRTDMRNAARVRCRTESTRS
jgi:hypothetical protein